MSDVKEFITHVMTNKEFQNLLRRVKISDDLSKDLGIPKWRLSTAFNGLIDAIRSHLGMSPRDTSVIEGAMSITEDIARTQSPNEAVEAGVRAGSGIDESEISPEARKRLDDGDRGAFYRNPKEIAEAVKGINAAAVKGIGKDLLTNKSAAFLKGHLNWLPGNYVEELHGHLFEDAKGHIIDAINMARNKVASTYRDLYRASADLRAQAYLTDRRYASQMPDYSDLVARSVRYNIHAEKVPTAPGKNREDVQRDANWAKAHEDYNKLPPALQRRYVAEKKFMIDSKKAEAEDILRNTIPLYDAPKGMTHEEVIKRALDNDLDADHWEHYEKEGADGYIRDAMRQMSGKDVYANSQRSEDERYVVHGRYDMPSGGNAKSMTGEDLPDNQREFATEKEMRDYAAATPLHAKMRDVAYVKDANGKLTDVYPKTPETEKAGLAGKRVRMADAEATGHRVTLERAHMETATDKAEGDRKRAMMEAAGVKELTGVLDRRDDKTWGKINTPQQKVLERRINSQSQLNDVSKQDLIKQTRQMALASANSYSGHQMMRRKVFGADFSSADGLADYAKASAQRAARMAHRAELDEAMTRMDDHVKANEGNPDTSLRMTSVAHNMWNRVHSDTLNSKINPTMHKIMAYAFTNFLVRPSHILLQQLHNYVYTVPHVAARYGAWKALQAQNQAMKDLGGRLSNLGKGFGGAGDILKSLKEGDIAKAVKLSRGNDAMSQMIDNGNLTTKERTAMRELMKTTLSSAYDSSTFEGGGMDRWNAILQQVTGAMEANNQLSAALSAYRLASAEGGHEAGLDYAKSVVEQTHGVYSSANIAPIMKHPIMKVAFQFRQQPMNLALMQINNAIKGWHGDKEAKRRFFYQLATAGAIGGLGGMPTMPFKAAGLAGMAMGGPNPSWYDDELHRAMANTLGTTVTNMIEYGLPSACWPLRTYAGSANWLEPGLLLWRA